MRSEVSHKLDDGYFVEAHADGDGEEKPKGRNEHHRGEEEHELPGVEGQSALPNLLQVLLNHVLRYGHLFEAGDDREKRRRFVMQ